MRRTPLALLLVTGLIIAGSALAGGAPPQVSYATQIRPILEKRCIGCHTGSAAGGGYQMTTRELLIRGGRHGTAVLPGKGAKSLLIGYLNGELMPRMPSSGPPLDMDTIRLIERWIDEGGKFDQASPSSAVKPAKTPKLINSEAAAVARQSAPATALEFAPDGKTLAVAGYRSVRLLDPVTGATVKTVSGPSDQVLSLAWSGDGKTLAIGGGVPGVRGEVQLWDAAAGKVLRTLATEHTDVVTSVSWRPGTRELATGSLDKTVRIWEADTGRCLRTLKEHADAVFSVCYAPDGKILATGSADRGVKLMDATTGKVLGTLSAHNDAVTHLSFNHDGSLLATTSADKTALIWKVQIGKMQNPERTVYEGDVITSCAFRQGGGFMTGAANHVIKVYSGDGSKHEQTLTEPKDWVYSVGFSPDGKTLAASGQNGMVYLWAGDGKPLTSVHLMPTNTTVARRGNPK